MLLLKVLVSPACLACPGCESPAVAPAAAAALIALLPADVATPEQHTKCSIMHKTPHALQFSVCTWLLTLLSNLVGCKASTSAQLMPVESSTLLTYHMSSLTLHKGIQETPWRLPTAVIHVQSRIYAGARVTGAGLSHSTHARLKGDRVRCFMSGCAYGTCHRYLCW